MNKSVTQESPAVAIGSIESISPGQGRCFVIEGEEIAVFHQRDGRVFAVQNRCPHRRGPLAEGLVGAGKVICPLHAHRFDLETGKSSEPKECLRTFRVSVVNGQIYIVANPAICMEPKC